MAVSVDGYFEGPDHDISWHMVDDEFNDFAVEQMKAIDTLFLGHRTYTLFEEFWPNARNMPDMTPQDLVIADMLDKMPKISFAHQPFETKWQNTQVVSGNVVEEVKKLKSQPGKEIAIFGSNNLCVSLMKEGLVDEFRIMVNPIAIGKGSSLFTGLEKSQKLRLATQRPFANGNILLIYRLK